MQLIENHLYAFVYLPQSYILISLGILEGIIGKVFIGSQRSLLNKMLSRPCKVQRSPAEHQMALDTRKWGVKEGRTLALLRAAAARFYLNCRYKVPTGTQHKVQVICSTASDQVVLPAHIAHHIHAQSDNNTALPSTAILSADFTFHCPSQLGRPGQQLVRLYSSTQANTLDIASWYIKGTNLKF